MKPVALVEHAIRNSSRRGEVVLDPFAGSGTTVIACEKAGRKARVMEVEPHYCDVIINRWQQFTGQEARLEDVGTTFGQARLNRAAELKKPEPATDIPCEQSN
jgi:DNA modification methylase